MRIFQPAFCTLFSVLLLSLTPVNGQNKLSVIIPEPVHYQYSQGVFELTGSTQFICSENLVSNKDLTDLIRISVLHALHFQPVVRDKQIEEKAAVQIILLTEQENLLGDEGYRLSVNPDEVRIVANSKAGIFYGLQSLLQLVSLSERTSMDSTPEYEIPSINVLDYPRFPWRGLMLDVSRHFFTVDEVKQFIDQMVKYKFNVFHWHLSDDQGWRVEIKSLPRLTDIGAWRVPRTGVWWTFDPPGKDEKPTEGGFYTQDQIREVVRYAMERNVTVLPEIDVPGHSLAMIAAYPELSSTGKQYFVNPGSKFYTIDDNSLCPGKEIVFETLDKVFTEIAELFPGQYIHIGGDECNKSFWKTSPECLALMKKENISGVDELQSWFIKRLESILKNKGKKLIGWDEILEGGLAPEATVMSWRGMNGGIEAAKMGHKVVMTPTDHCYLDLYQGDPAIEPATYSMLRLSDVYRFEPVPPGVDKNLVLGGQGNLWTESVATLRHAEYMTWPRGLALAEVLWSQAEARNWDAFIDRLEYHFDLFDRAKVNYSTSAFEPIIRMDKVDGKRKISIATEVGNLNIHYSFDESFPDAFYPKYESQIEIPKGSSKIRAVAVRDGQIIGKMVSIDLKELEKRMK